MSIRKCLIFTAVLAAIYPIQSFAVGSGGLMNEVVGTKALGAGNTFVAVADDASAIYFNPAGLTQLEGTSLSLGGTYLNNESTYAPDSGSKTTMNNNDHFVPFIHAAHTFGRWAFGVGVTSPFGLATDWGEDSSFRYVATKSEIKTYEINPTVALRISDTLSIGAGVDYLKASTVDLERQVNITGLNAVIRAGFGLPAAAVYPDAKSKLDGDSDGWGYNFGVLWKPSSKHALGASYRSEIATTVNGTEKIDGLADESAALFGGTSYSTQAHSSLDFPDSILLGYAFKPTERTTYTFDTEWVGWSEQKATTVDYGESNPQRVAVLKSGSDAKNDWNDSTNFGVGIYHQLNEIVQLRTGYWYFAKVVPEATFSPSLPDSARHAITLGTGIGKGPFMLDIAYNAVFFQDRKVGNSVGATSGETVNGKYESLFHLVSLGVSYRFR